MEYPEYEMTDAAKEELVKIVGPLENQTKMNEELHQLYEKRMDEIRDDLNKEIEADKVYFENHPERNHRMRLAFPVEKLHFRLYESFHGQYIEESLAMAVIVKQTGPGERIRVPYVSPPSHMPDEEWFESLSEEHVISIWENMTKH